MSRALFKSWMQFFDPIVDFEKGPVKPGVMTSI